ncbi:hypothetical protein SAMN05428949_3024 [Chitinophaga sp. YR627]|uniref:hypothetical protein n=1 Tax=Chitinophaga sp. YR627 TaxID=1881041 RepID=UPI0008E94DB4|nr:hypothetical protein [Chitinophaga sp. YR627]SFN49311.1 hypothetical protein SAMN05428949_3024 [Chitinophaga sp. YR627]
MKSPLTPDLATSTRAVANVASEGAISQPAVPFSKAQSNNTDAKTAPEEVFSEDLAAAGKIETPLEIDMDEDGVLEPHTLFIDPEDGELWLHSDAQTLSVFLQRKRNKHKKNLSSQVIKLLANIEAASKIIHTGKYGTRGSNNKKKAPTTQERQAAQFQLRQVAVLLQQLNILTNVIMKKQRPPSHQEQLVTRTIGSDVFCEKVVMAPLSILRRDDNIEGSQPVEETVLWNSVKKFAGYKRGHMLNEHLHGPGTNNNLVPISTAFNSTMKTGVERATKDAVNGNNKVVRFEAEALNWGSYPGAFGYPDEKKLPAKFRFKVTQMQLIPGHNYDGSLIQHWQDSTTVIYEDSPDHDIPVDLVKGVVAPVIKKFVPGIYFHPGGKIQLAPTGKNYHLIGNFSINNDHSLLPALALDDPSQLTASFIRESVLTEYEVPNGYEIIYPFPPTQLDYIYKGKIEKYPTQGFTFLVRNIAEHPKLEKEYEGQKQLIIDAEKLQQQQVLDIRQEQERLKREQQEQFRLKKEKEKQQQERQQQNDDYRHNLLGKIRVECRKYESKFGSDGLSRYKEERENCLYYANTEWKGDTDLFDKEEDSLLEPIRSKIVKIKDEILIWEIDLQKKREKIELLKISLNEKINEKFLPEFSDKPLRYFNEKVEEIIDRYSRHWEKSSRTLSADFDELLKSPLENVEVAYNRTNERFSDKISTSAIHEKKTLKSGPFRLSQGEDRERQSQRDRKMEKEPFRLTNASFNVKETKSEHPNPLKRKGSQDNILDTEKVAKQKTESFTWGVSNETTGSSMQIIAPFTLSAEVSSNITNSDNDYVKTVIDEISGTVNYLSENMNVTNDLLIQLKSFLPQFAVNPTAQGKDTILNMLKGLQGIDNEGLIDACISMWESL